MNDVLNATGRLGAELGAVKAENEKLRGLLEETLRYIDDETATAAMMSRLAARISAALSQQAEPAEPAPAQDEKAAFDDWYPLGCPGAGVTAQLSALAGFRAGAAWQRTRPAQTEQLPVAWQCRCVCEECVDADWSGCSFEQYQMAIADPDMQARALFAAPVTLPASFTKFQMGDRVNKSTGSEWQGRIVGTYSTELTPEGYAVESEAHKGSVQIYPAKALEAVE